MSAPDPADLVHRRALAAVSRDVPARACPSCGAELAPRRLFCTEYCRTALHRIRRTEADLDRLRRRLAAAAGEVERTALDVEIRRVEARRDARDARLAARRAEQQGRDAAVG